MRPYEMEDISHLINMRVRLHRVFILKGFIDIWDLELDLKLTKRVSFLNEWKLQFDVQSKPMSTALKPLGDSRFRCISRTVSAMVSIYITPVYFSSFNLLLSHHTKIKLDYQPT